MGYVRTDKWSPSTKPIALDFENREWREHRTDYVSITVPVLKAARKDGQTTIYAGRVSMSGHSSRPLPFDKHTVTIEAFAELIEYGEVLQLALDERGMLTTLVPTPLQEAMKLGRTLQQAQDWQSFLPGTFDGWFKKVKAPRR